MKNHFLSFDFFGQNYQVQSETRSCCGAVFGLAIFLATLQYAVIQFTSLYLRDGYSVNYDQKDNFYRDEHLELTVGERNEEQNYPFNLMLTALDTETGRYPEDLSSLGQLKIRLWEHSFKVDEGQDVPINNYQDILYEKCSRDQIEQFDFEGEEK